MKCCHLHTGTVIEGSCNRSFDCCNFACDHLDNSIKTGSDFLLFAAKVQHKEAGAEAQIYVQ